MYTSNWPVDLLYMLFSSSELSLILIFGHIFSFVFPLHSLNLVSRCVLCAIVILLDCTGFYVTSLVVENFRVSNQKLVALGEHFFIRMCKNLFNYSDVKLLKVKLYTQRCPSPCHLNSLNIVRYLADQWCIDIDKILKWIALHNHYLCTLITLLDLALWQLTPTLSPPSPTVCLTASRWLTILLTATTVCRCWKC